MPYEWQLQLGGHCFKWQRLRDLPWTVHRRIEIYGLVGLLGGERVLSLAEVEDNTNSEAATPAPVPLTTAPVPLTTAPVPSTPIPLVNVALAKPTSQKSWLCRPWTQSSARRRLTRWRI